MSLSSLSNNKNSTAYLNGEFLPIDMAYVSVLDRGFLFADSVYEVIPVYGRHLFRLAHHLERLQASLDGIQMPNPLTNAQWESILTELIARNKSEDQSLYLQITRGADTERQHLFPLNLKPTLFVMSNTAIPISPRFLKKGATVITLDDIRWRYRNLKTTALLANILLRLEAEQHGADEAILIQDSLAGECTSSNFFLVKQGCIITPPKSERLLPGITRDLILELASENNIPYQEIPVYKTQLSEADELWLTSSTKELIPVVRLNGLAISNGKPGLLWNQLYIYFQDYKERVRKGLAN